MTKLEAFCWDSIPKQPALYSQTLSLNTTSPTSKVMTAWCAVGVSCCSQTVLCLPETDSRPRICARALYPQLAGTAFQCFVQRMNKRAAATWEFGVCGQACLLKALHHHVVDPLVRLIHPNLKQGSQTLRRNIEDYLIQVCRWPSNLSQLLPFLSGDIFLKSTSFLC